jgi:imidazolonepropionase-like amidohydrolase
MQGSEVELCMSTRATSLWITNARLVDGTGSPPQVCALRIGNERIAEIVPEPPVGAEPTLDVAGATVVPGLIDPHVHLQAVPGAAYRGDGQETRRHARLHQLRAYLACGVTTVLDAGIAPDVLRSIQVHLAEGGVHRRLSFNQPP